MGQQSLSVSAPDAVQQFKHNLSLASSSRSDDQRRDALSYLTSQLASQPPVNPVGTHAVLAKLLPLISDSSTPVRSQLLKLLRCLPGDQVKHSAEQAIMFVRAGMTHLSVDINNDALGVMEWLLEVAADDIVECPGGWVKTLKSFCAMMGWVLTKTESGWSQGAHNGLRAKNVQTQARQIAALSRFLQAGLKPEAVQPPVDDLTALRESVYRLPREPNAFAHLNLAGLPRDEDGEMYQYRDARQRILHRRFYAALAKNVEQAKKEGGAAGRAAAVLDKVLEEGMADYEDFEIMDEDYLLNLG
jgi:pre-rRNA-processing protein IPI1